MSENQLLLHKAEETGQSRELKTPEVGATTLMSTIETVTLALAASSVVIVVQCLQDSITWETIGTAAGVGLVIVGPVLWFNVVKNFAEMREGQRSYRSIETYAPPVPEPQPVSTPSSPVIVKPYGGDPYILNGDEKLALPDGRQTALGLNPPTLAAVLQEVIQQHDGQWSRRRLMGIRVQGERITRKLYEELTNALTNAHFLQPQPNGGYSLPPDVQSFDDLANYLPGLPGTAGRTAGRQEPGGQIEPPPSRGRGGYAQRCKERWLECGCDVEVYRGRKS